MRGLSSVQAGLPVRGMLRHHAQPLSVHSPQLLYLLRGICVRQSGPESGAKTWV